MATYQTTYGNAPAKGLPGQIASEEKCNKISRTVETAAGIAFGQPVQRGTGDHGVAILSSGTFIGLAVLNPAVPPVAPGATLVDGYPQYFTGAFMTMGQMYVTAGGAVTDGAQVYWNTTSKRFTAADTDVEIPGAVFDTSGGDGDIVEISLQLRPHSTVHPAAV